MKKVIRIEHNDGCGMFCTQYDTLSELCFSAYHRHREMPTPYTLGYDLQNDEFCAYESMGEMNKWLRPGEIKILLEHGYRVLELHLAGYEERMGQVFYRKEEILETIDISNLFK